MIVLRCSHQGRGYSGVPVILDMFEPSDGGRWTTMEDRAADANFRIGVEYARNPYLSITRLDEEDEPYRHGEAGYGVAELEQVIYERMKAGTQDQRAARTVARYACPCGIDHPADARALESALGRLASAGVEYLELKNLPLVL